MNEIKEGFNLDIPAIIVTLFLLMAGINKGVEILGKFSHTIGKPFKWAKSKESKIESTAGELERLKKQHKKDTTALHKEITKVMTEIKAQVRELKEQMETFSNNRISDRQQSFSIQEQLVKAQDKISDGLNKLIARVEANEEKEAGAKQSEIKSKIAQLYRRYRVTQCITDNELEALEDLITTYEKYGGKNSFVHSKVQVEMYTWKVIDTPPQQKNNQ